MKCTTCGQTGQTRSLLQGLNDKPSCVIQASEADGGIGSTLEYNLRFYSTLPDTFENNFKMNVGILPSDAIIADRAWNTAAVADATLGYGLDTLTLCEFDSPVMYSPPRL